MTSLPDGLTLHRADGLAEIPIATFYRIARLRQEVFVVEQDCPYLDLDGRDLEPGAVQLWAADEHGEIAASMRILDESAGASGAASIGRVVTAPAWRGRGAAGAVLRAAIEACGERTILIHAQSYLRRWYEGFGFVVSGDEFSEDGIPHLPMRIR